MLLVKTIILLNERRILRFQQCYGQQQKTSIIKGNFVRFQTQLKWYVCLGYFP